VNALADQAISLDPRYFYGFAHMFIGTANSMLPAAFGGDKEKALRAFETISALNNGKFLLSKVFYARFYLTDDAAVQQTLNGVVEAPDRLIPEIELMNQIAKAKARHYLNK
ncbi:MAG: TRAP transporter TatT component family protein, partial [Thermodesulfobacteriota bacterium]